MSRWTARTGYHRPIPPHVPETRVTEVVFAELVYLVLTALWLGSMV